jgi:hypothetical protein
MKPSYLFLSCGLALTALVSGCATATQPTAMAATSTPIASHQTSGDLGVAVSGGRETSSVGASQVSNEDFGAAIVASITHAQLFSKVAYNSPGRYQLNAYISKVSQPMLGFSMTVSMEVSYSLVDKQNSQTLWQKTISSEHTAAMGEAFAGVTRLRLATEGAAKQNIDSLLRELNQVSLP